MSAQAECPKCHGSTRRPCPPECLKYRMAGFDESDKSLPCEECRANAILIAAAPELLEALKLIAFKSGNEEIIRLARIAIAKATEAK